MLSLLALSGGFTESSTDPPAVPPANRQVGGAAGGSVEGALNGHDFGNNRKPIRDFLHKSRVVLIGLFQLG